MDKLIPDYLQNDVACVSIQDGLDKVDVVILKNNGELLELSAGQVVDSVKLTGPVDLAEDITTYYRYRPSKKYYLVRIGTDLHVVEKREKLKVYKRIENVLYAKVADYYGTGDSSVILKINFRSEPLVLDLNGESSEGSDILMPVIEKDILFSQLQSVKFHIEKAKTFLKKRKDLTDKVLLNIIKRGSLQLEEHLNEMEIDYCNLSVVGTPVLLFVGNNLNIAVHVYNSYMKEIPKVEIQVFSPISSCQTVIIIKKKKENTNSELEDFEVVHSLPAESSGYLIGTFENFQFCNTEFLCNGILTYTLGEETAVHCVKLNFKTINLEEQMGMVSQEVLQTSETDILIILIATAVKNFINIEFFDYCSLSDIFSKLGFEKCCDNYYLYPIWSNNFMKGILVRIIELKQTTSSKVSLCIYGRDKTQLGLFARMFYNSIRNENAVHFSRKENELLVLNRLSEEINYIMKCILSSKTNENRQIVSNYVKLSECQKNTDSIMNDCSEKIYNLLSFIDLC